MAEITAANIKYVAWNSDNSLCALMGKHGKRLVKHVAINTELYSDCHC